MTQGQKVLVYSSEINEDQPKKNPDFQQMKKSVFPES